MHWRALLAAMTTVITVTIAGWSLQSLAAEMQPDTRRDDATIALFRRLGKNSTWELAEAVEMQGWQTFHTQGLVKIGPHFYVSAVEVLEDRVRFGETDALFDFSLDRTPGAGRGWLFKFDGTGMLLGRIEITQGIIYHPGGIDYDGEYLWVPVAEYRPNSNSVIYRVDPQTLQAQKVFTEEDHIGGIVHNPHRDTFHGVSWGSRRLYEWKVQSKPDGQARVKSTSWVPNPQHSIDYQDCHAVGVDYMLCGGLNHYDTPAGRVGSWGPTSVRGFPGMRSLTTATR